MMPTFLTGFWSWFTGTTIGRYTAIAIAALVGLFLLRWKWRSDGEQARIGKEQETARENESVRRKIDDKVNTMPESDVDKQLDRWTRP